MNSQNNIYDEVFVENLFNRMSQTYGMTNYISSFGFTERWRKKCVQEINWSSDLKEGYDFMSGMGESWGIIFNASHPKIKITGIDISKAMNKKAQEKLNRYPHWNIETKEENILKNSLLSDSADFIISTFGLKTFSAQQLDILADEIKRVLKKGGQFSMVEISRPQYWLLTPLYLFYLKRLIPIIGWLFMGNSLDYKMLGIYCEAFGNCQSFADQLRSKGLEVECKSYFFGCATTVVGLK